MRNLRRTARRSVIGVDIGGTFTDVVLQEGLGVSRVLKIPTNPKRPADAVLLALRDLGAGVPDQVLHATTLATNALLDPPPGLHGSVGLLTTEGFRDVIEIGRQNRPSLYDLFFRRPPPLVDRQRREEVPERTGPSGRVLRRTDPAAVRRGTGRLSKGGVRTLAIVFLHSYANPSNERRAAAIARRKFPYVSLSSEVAPEPREFERASTTLVNAALMPVVSEYVVDLRHRLETAGVRSSSVMASSGGLISLTEAANRPVQIVESGPTAGVVAAAALARRLDLRSVVSFDMGGTTAKAGTVVDGRIELAAELEVGGTSHHGRRAKGTGYPVRFPVVDLAEVLAGGGTIIHRDAGGTLRIGPQSAGAVPGPIAYGRGGTTPTLTDANLVAGLLAPRLLGGGISLDVRAARDGLARLGSPLPVAGEALDLANLEMARAIRLVTVERGRDPRPCTLVAFGGAGPQHAAAVADEVGARDVVVPREPGVFSAVGLLQSDGRTEARAAFPNDIADALRRLRRELRRRGPADRFVVSADVRYRGQGSELAVPVRAPDRDRITADFVRLHQRTFGFRLNRDVEIVTLRVFGELRRAKPRVQFRPTGPPKWGERSAHWHGREIRVTTCDRDRLLAGTRVRGPASIEEYGSTTFVPPGWKVAVLRDGDLRLTRAAR